MDNPVVMIQDFKYLTFRLFLLRIGKSDNKWRVAYGIVTPAQEKMGNLAVSESSQIGTCANGKMSIKKIVWAAEQDIVLRVFDDLAHGISLTASFERGGIKADEFGFDVEYSQDAVDEPWGAEIVMTSQLTYTKSICMRNPLQLFEKDGVTPSDVEKAMAILENHLRSLTKLPFGDGFDHVGNLDIVVAPDRDVFGKPLVECHWQKGEVFVQEVILHKELIEKDDELLINLVCKENRRIVSDTIERILVSNIDDIVKRYQIKKCPDSLEIKIWRVREGKSLVVSDTLHFFLKHISLNMGMMDGKVRISTKWLQKIRETVPKNKQDEVDKAATIERSEQINAEIGDSIRKRMEKRNPIKSNDEFFPKGWNSEDDEHGLLSFLEWFKKKANGARFVFLQDPYFEDVAMFFLASADISSEYTVLTQTKLKTNTNGTIKIDGVDYDADIETDVKTEEDGRKTRILDGIKANPQMFGPMKLVIIDIPITHNVLHDRYLVFDFGDGNVEAYTLSNSLQGATNKQPLLVTQIGDAAFAKVNEHIKNTLKSKEVETIYNYAQKTDSVSDKEKFNNVYDGDLLKMLYKNKNGLMNGDVGKVLDEIRAVNTNNRLVTLGFFLASIHDDEAYVIIGHMGDEMCKDTAWIDILTNYILATYNASFPMGYRNCLFKGRSLYDPTIFLYLDYNHLVTSYNVNFLDYIGSERYTFGVYGHLFVAKLLLKSSVPAYVDLLKQLRSMLIGITIDKTATSCYKVTAMLMNELLESDYWLERDDVKRALLADPEEWCRGVGALLLLQKVKDEDFDCEVFLANMKNEDELEKLCHAAWGMKPAPAHKDLFYRLLVEIFKNKKDRAYFKGWLFKEVLGETHFKEDIVDYTKNVIIPLINSGLVDKDELSREIVEAIYDNSISGQHTIMMKDVLPECLYVIGGDLRSLYEKAEKTLKDSKERLKRIPVKSEDIIFEETKECINLRLILLSLVEKYTDSGNDTIERIRVLLKDLDLTLDSYGMKRVKRAFENLR